MKLMQQIVDMRVEMQQRLDLPPPGFASTAADGRPTMYFPSSNMDQTHNQPSTPAQNPSVIDLTSQNTQYSSASYQTPPSPQNNHPRIPPHPQNTHHQSIPPP